MLGVSIKGEGVADGGEVVNRGVSPVPMLREAVDDGESSSLVKVTTYCPCRAWCGGILEDIWVKPWRKRVAEEESEGMSRLRGLLYGLETPRDDV